jgi:agmatine deiminase
VTLANKAALVAAATDAKGRSLNIVTLTAPTNTRSTDPDFAAGYIGFYACNGAIIAQQFGDAAADLAAKTKLQAAFPNRVIEQLNVDNIATGGGSIHCSTQQQPL